MRAEARTLTEPNWALAGSHKSFEIAGLGQGSHPCVSLNFSKLESEANPNENKQMNKRTSSFSFLLGPASEHSQGRLAAKVDKDSPQEMLFAIPSRGSESPASVQEALSSGNPANPPLLPCYYVRVERDLSLPLTSRGEELSTSQGNPTNLGSVSLSENQAEICLSESLPASLLFQPVL